MTKTYGANIRCSVCGGEPWPDDPATRECFDLTRAGDVWFCEQHRPPRKHAPRAVAVTPDEALNEVARTFADRGAHLDEAIASAADVIEGMRCARANAAAAAIDAVSLAFNSCREEFEHSLNAAKKTLAPPKPARDPHADGPKREKRKLSLAGRKHEGQGELTEPPPIEDAAPAHA